MDIPAKFNNSLSEEKFISCSICQADLSQPDTEYIIEKAFKRFPENMGEELLFEIAVCFQCANNMRSELSKESMNNIQDFFLQKNMEQRLSSPNENADPLEKCLLSGKAISSMSEYQIYAHCRGGHLAENNSFYMLSDDIIENIQDLLSDQTREQLEKFKDDLGMPPELRRLFASGDVILI